MEKGMGLCLGWEPCGHGDEAKAWFLQLWPRVRDGINKSQKLVGAPVPLLTNQDKKLA